METYKIKITFRDRTYKYIQVKKDKLIKSGNVIKYVQSRYKEVVEIKTRSKNQSGGYYWELNYSPFFERCMNNRIRVERTNKQGYEDYSGYGAQTDGRKNRFYIGRSTGFVPVYLEIHNTRSSGGGSLFTIGTFQTV